MAGPIDWAFSWVWSKLFAFSPKVSREKGMLVARTAWRGHLFSFGAASRDVAIDPNRRMVRIRRRSFWFLRTTRFIPFNGIREVSYGYDDVDPSQGWSWSHQQDDLFTVGLKLASGEDLLLFRFYGQGEFSNNGPFPDWFYWDEMIEANITRGNQEGDSRAFAEVVSGIIGVPIGSPRL